MSVQQDLSNDGILTLTLNRPEKLNALNDTVLTELSEIFDTADKQTHIKGLLITGNGKAFCAGADINQLAEADAQSGLAFAQKGQAVFNQLEQLSKPSLACINGYAFGGGLELAMAATLRIAATAAQCGQPEITLGVIPGYGGTQRLPRLVGKGRALELCLTAKKLSASEAFAWGLFNEVLDATQLLERGNQLIREITGLAPLATQHIMTCIHRGFDLTLDEGLHLEATHFALSCATEDKQEGTRAFLEKRTAIFQGR